MEVYLHSFLTLALDGGEWSISCSGRFIPLGKSHQYHLCRRMGGCSWARHSGRKITVMLLLLGSEPQIIRPIAQLLTASLAPDWSHGCPIEDIVLYKEFLHGLNRRLDHRLKGRGIFKWWLFCAIREDACTKSDCSRHTCKTKEILVGTSQGV